MTTKTEIRQWIERGQEKGAAFMIVACDTFDWDDYPVFVTDEENLQDKVKLYDRVNMQKIMEVYDLRGDIPAQLNMVRARADLRPAPPSPTQDAGGDT